jgi:copper(I)-binding protein
MKTRLLATLATMCLIAPHAFAEVSITDPWAKASVPAQKMTGAYMKITSTEDARLIALHSPAAEVVELHEMKKEGDHMSMRAVPELKLAAGVTVELKPGGYHVMLLGLKAQVREGDTLPLSLTIESANGSRQTIEIKAAVRALGASSGMLLPDRH